MAASPFTQGGHHALLGNHDHRDMWGSYGGSQAGIMLMRFLAVVVGLVVTGTATAAQAGLITLNYSGELTAVDIELDALFSVGDPFYGFITYDTDTLDVSSDPSNGRYIDAITSMSFVLPGTYNFVPTIPGSIFVHNAAPGEHDPRDFITFEVGDPAPIPQSFPNPGFPPLYEWRFSLTDTTSTVFSDDELVTSLNSFDFDKIRLSFAFEDRPGHHSLLFSTQFVLTTVPLPATLPLFLSGLAGLSFFGWRSSKAAKSKIVIRGAAAGGGVAGNIVIDWETVGITAA